LAVRAATLATAAAFAAVAALLVAALAVAALAVAAFTVPALAVAAFTVAALAVAARVVALFAALARVASVPAPLATAAALLRAGRFGRGAETVPSASVVAAPDRCAFPWRCVGTRFETFSSVGRRELPRAGARDDSAAAAVSGPSTRRRSWWSELMHLTSVGGHCTDTPGGEEWDPCKHAVTDS
jgi:hypothetical protein